jgi:hypothetical protein
MMLVLIGSLGLHFLQADVSIAYVQSKLDAEVYMEIPKGFGDLLPQYKSLVKDNSCLRLLRSLYGLKQAGALWFSTLVSAILSFGFTRSSYD